MQPSEAHHFSSTAPGGRLIVVDHVEHHRALMTDRLAADGYTVQLASDGLEALELVTAFNPDAILLDVMMPKMDGVEICRRLKSDPATFSIPVLLTAECQGRAERLHGFFDRTGVGFLQAGSRSPRRADRRRKSYGAARRRCASGRRSCGRGRCGWAGEHILVYAPGANLMQTT